MDINWHDTFLIFFTVFGTHFVWLMIFLWICREKPTPVAQTTIFCDRCSFTVSGDHRTFDINHAMKRMDDHYKVHAFFGDYDHND